MLDLTAGFKRTAVRLALVAGLGLLAASCQEDLQDSLGMKAARPLKAEMIGLMEDKGMRKEDPILLRIFKQESQLEVWKRDKTGRYAQLKSYKICAWGGTVGPKIKEGDKQSPEGFYSVEPWRMNPNSQYHLSFDVGFPNAFDKAWGRNGANVMVHGACSSAGCFAMTDAQVEEIYALAREAFAGGQTAFQVQSYPFKMTPQNMAKVRSNPNMPFWRNLKEGYDHFEVTKLEPKVEVCEKRYVFDPQLTSTTSTMFNPSGACPAFKVPDDIAGAVASKQRQDDQEFQVAAAEVDAAEKVELDKKLEQARAAAAANPPRVMVASQMTPLPKSLPANGPAPTATGSARALAVAPVEAKPEKSFWDRLNPFGS